MPTEPNREETLFAAALNLPADERAPFLDRECAGDALLRQRVEALLHADAQADQFLEQPTAGVSGETVLVTPGMVRVTEQSGERIGRYKLLEKIGEGGFGDVWMAEQEEPVRRRVALKIIKVGMDTREVVARFEAERQALALMDHPNIAHVFDGGATDTGRPYFVMELVRGLPITNYCDEHRLNLRERLELFVQVCQSVQHAHQKGVIHRDLKPSNILVAIHDDKAVPKVIDFGIAKATQQRLTERTLFTRFNQFIGTPAYMSPEQAGLSSLDADTRSDIYSLGVLLYELLTGRTPFAKEELMAAGYDEICRIIREKEPPKPSTRLSTLSAAERSAIAAQRKVPPEKLGRLVRGELDWVVMKALEKDRTRRYESATAFAHDIERFLHHEPVAAVAPSAAYRFRKLVRRNKLAFAAASAVTVALVSGVVVSTWQAIRARRAESKAQTESILARAAEKTAIEKSQLAEMERQAARQNLYVADMNLAQQSLEMNNLGRIVGLLDRHRPKPGETDLRGWEWRNLWKECQSDALFTLYEHSNAICGLAFSVDGSLVAVGGDDGVVKLFDITTRREVATLQGTQQAWVGDPLLAFSPQGTLLAFCDPAGVTLCEKGSWKKIGHLAYAGEITSLAFSPDGRLLATFQDDGTVRLWDLEKRSQIRSFPTSRPFGSFDGKVAFGPDGKTLAVGELDGRIRLLEVPSGTEKKSWRVHTFAVTALEFSPDGKTLASGAFVPTSVRLINVADGNEVGSYDTHRGFVFSVAFSPDGNILASSSVDQSIRLWDVVQRRELATLRGHLQEVWRVAFSPDGKTLVSGSKGGSVKVWSTTPKPGQKSFAVLPTRIAVWTPVFVQNFAFLQDSTTMATVGLDEGSVALWDTRTLERTEKLSELGTNNLGIAVSPDGDRLVVSDSKTHSLKVWNLTQKRAVTNIAEAGIPITFDSKGKILVTSDGVTIRIWDTAWWTKRLEWKFEGLIWKSNSIHSIAACPDKPSLAIGGNEGLVAVWNIDTGRQEKELRVHQIMGLGGVAFSPDGKILAAGSESGTGRVWDTASWQETGPPLRGHLQGIHWLAFSPDGRRLATGGTSGPEAVKLWDVATHQELATLRGDGFGFAKVAFSPDGDTLVAVNANGDIHVWRAPSFAEIDAAERTQSTAR